MTLEDLVRLARSGLIKEQLLQRCQEAGLTITTFTASGRCGSETAQYSQVEVSTVQTSSGKKGNYFIACNKQAGEIVIMISPERRMHLVLVNNLQLRYDMSGQNDLDEHTLITVAVEQLDQTVVAQLQP